jgi:hypothetical protein
MQQLDFQQSNKAFAGQLRTNKKDNLDQSRPRPSISKEDLHKLYAEYFNDKWQVNNTILLQKIYFEIVYYLCRRGCEGLESLKISDLDVQLTTDGRRFLVSKINQTTKRYQGDDVSGRHGSQEPNIILENTEDQNCPVKSFLFYKGKVETNECKALFQRANPKMYRPEFDKWYQNKPVGKNTIAKFMPTISIQASLSQSYTNHCIRNTSLTAMHRAGFSLHEISCFSKHKNIQSLKHYLDQPTLEDKMNYNVALANYSKGHKKNKAAETHPNPTSNAEIQYPDDGPPQEIENQENFTEPRQNPPERNFLDENAALMPVGQGTASNQLTNVLRNAPNAPNMFHAANFHGCHINFKM